MPDLYITRAMPNPPGKDRSRQNPTNTKLNEEWLEFANTKGAGLSIAGVSLLHQTFNDRCQRTGERVLTTFSTGHLPAGHSIRVHTGSGTGAWDGTVFHFYLGKSSFVWNNECGDTARLTVAAGEVDHAWYAPSPPEHELRRAQGSDQLR